MSDMVSRLGARRVEPSIRNLRQPSCWTPCPATVQAVLGLEKSAVLPCGRLAGHEPPHRYSIEWTDTP